MKTFLALSIAIVGHCSAQGLTENADGTGTVLFRGNSASFDIGKTELNMNLNNLKYTLGKPMVPFYGMQASGQNNSGLGDIFNNGNFVPAATLGGYVGLSFSWGVPENYEEEYKQKKNTWKAIETKFDQQYKAAMQSILLQYNTGSASSLAQVMAAALGNGTIETYLETIKNWPTPADEESQDLLEDLKDKAQELYKQYRRKVKPIKKWIAHDHRIVTKGKPYKQLLLFGFGAFEGSEFKLAQPIDLTNLEKSFKTIEYRGGWGGLGANFQLKNLMLGATWSYRESNNFSLLGKQEYTYTTVTTNSTGSLTATKKIVAYYGDYDEVTINEVKADAIYRFNLSEDDKAGQLLVNAYMRSQNHSRNTKLLPNKTDFGIGTYLFNKEKKFIGGLYIELPDVNNNYEKNEPTEDQHLRPALKRITFGVVGKLSIATLMNTF